MNHRQRAPAVRATGALFAALGAAHLIALAAHLDGVHHLTKPALMPALALHAAARGAPRPLLAALLFGCGGDTLLQLDDQAAFLAGMGSFAAGHLCYLVLFARLGTANGRSRTYGLTTAYGTAWLGTVALLWPGLESGLRLPVAGYALLLTAMALGATRVGVRTAVGGLLFLLSDTLIASGLADWPQPPVPQLCIMVTYLAAQYLLTDGLLRAAPETGSDRTRTWGRARPAARPHGSVTHVAEVSPPPPSGR
ncbi:lysoplasmalogenase [Streptomyces sp. NPDC050610]|uniref:lysoplasmalogenase n=1 Tax=Streptomyces sp. NPDC050610 TaxID=3157097 RepID=UPI003435E1AD